MRNASGHQGENEEQWKKENKNMYDISSIKQRHKFKKVCCAYIVAFLLITLDL